MNETGTQQPNVLTLTETAELMQVSMGTLRRILLRNELPAFKVGGQWRVNERELTKWMETLSAAFRTL